MVEATRVMNGEKIWHGCGDQENGNGAKNVEIDWAKNQRQEKV